MTLHFYGRPYESCRELSCYSATLGPFCSTHAALADKPKEEPDADPQEVPDRPI